jgi:histidinol phosphatase-like enzyme (inositol monophosphatase family)
MPYNTELKIALEAVSAAGIIQLKGRENLLNVEIKSDNSPVTQIDKKCETVIRDMIEKHFPRDGFLGEETGSNKGSSGRTWIVDPLDGTRPYIKGIPTHSVLIALEDAGDVVVGCMHLPSLCETYFAQKGQGAFLNNSPIHVSQTKSLDKVMGSALGYLEEHKEKDGTILLSLMKKWDYSYGFMDAYTYGCIAAGRLDVSVNLWDKPWDCAAGACIVREAGGRFSDINGKQTVYSGNIILSNGFVHDAVLEYFQ